MTELIDYRTIGTEKQSYNLAAAIIIGDSLKKIHQTYFMVRGFQGKTYEKHEKDRPLILVAGTFNFWSDAYVAYLNERQGVSWAADVFHKIQERWGETPDNENTLYLSYKCLGQYIHERDSELLERLKKPIFTQSYFRHSKLRDIIRRIIRGGSHTD